MNKIVVKFGGSIGSFQALEWGVMESNAMDRLIIIAGSAKTSPWLVAFNEAQRMAIRADQTYFLDTDKGEIEGMKAARAIALLSYRNDEAYNSTQPIENDDDYLRLKAISYQQYQGEKLAKRFNAYSYYRLTRSADSHNLGKNRKSLEQALALIKAKTLIIGIDSDVLFPVEQQQQMRENIKDSDIEIIESKFGHDGFLIENEKIKNVITKFYNKK